MREIEGSEFELDAELVLLAVGFVGPERPLIEELALSLTMHDTVRVDSRFMTRTPGVFACGDTTRGASLVVWAIYEGRETARNIDAFLMGQTHLPTLPGA